MGRMTPEELEIVPFSKCARLAEFGCGDADLDSFVKKDAKSYEESRIARTYAVLHGGRMAGYFSLCTDTIKLSEEEMVGAFGMEKTHLDYPAVKIVRLAVSSQYCGMGIGTYMVRQALGKIIVVSGEVGCRFATVDAYASAEQFYAKCGFIRNLKDRSGANISMRYDLINALRK